MNSRIDPLDAGERARVLDWWLSDRIQEVEANEAGRDPGTVLALLADLTARQHAVRMILGQAEWPDMYGPLLGAPPPEPPRVPVLVAEVEPIDRETAEHYGATEVCIFSYCGGVEPGDAAHVIVDGTVRYAFTLPPADEWPQGEEVG